LTEHITLGQFLDLVKQGLEGFPTFVAYLCQQKVFERRAVQEHKVSYQNDQYYIGQYRCAGLKTFLNQPNGKVEHTLKILGEPSCRGLRIQTEFLVQKSYQLDCKLTYFLINGRKFTEQDSGLTEEKKQQCQKG